MTIDPLPGRSGLVICGEIDIANHHLLRQALAVLAAEDADESEPVQLDLSGLRFIDVAGLAELAGFATQRRLVLHAPPPQVRRLADLFWLDRKWAIQP